MKKDFWSNSVVAVLGGGSWGTVLGSMLAQNAKEVRLWTRDDTLARDINSNRVNSRYLPEFKLPEAPPCVLGYSESPRRCAGSSGLGGAFESDP